MGVALQGDPRGTGLIVGCLVAHDLRGNLGRDAGVVEPGSRCVAGLVQTDWLQLEIAPALVDATLQGGKGDQAGFRAAPRRADPARLRLALGQPLAFEDCAQRRDKGDDPPGAAGLAAVLVAGQLDGAELEVDVPPVQDLNLLAARGSVAGKSVGNRVAEGLAGAAGLLLFKLSRRLAG